MEQYEERLHVQRVPAGGSFNSRVWDVSMNDSSFGKTKKICSQLARPGATLYLSPREASSKAQSPQQLFLKSPRNPFRELLQHSNASQTLPHVGRPIARMTTASDGVLVWSSEDHHTTFVTPFVAGDFSFGLLIVSAF